MHQQKSNSSKPATLDDLTKTLDYTFIDLPELVDGSEDADSYVDPGNHLDAAQPCWHTQQAQQLQAQQQQQLQQANLQHLTQAGHSQQYAEMPFWQQLQQGAQSQPQQPVLGPLGQALTAAMHGNPPGSRQALQPQQRQQQQQQQQHHHHHHQQQQQQQLCQPGGSFGSAQVQQSAAGQTAAAPQAQQQPIAADMDEG